MRMFRAQPPQQRRDAILSRRDPAGTAEALHYPGVERARWCIENGVCPFCGRQGFRVLAGHTAKIHGVDGRQLRDLAELTYSTSICAPDVREACAERARGSEHRLGRAGGKGTRRQLSVAAKADMMRRIEAIHNRSDFTDIRQRASLASGRSRRKPHPCPICGTMLPRSTPKTCSPECRLEVRRRTGRAVLQRRRRS